MGYCCGGDCRATCSTAELTSLTLGFCANAQIRNARQLDAFVAARLRSRAEHLSCVCSSTMPNKTFAGNIGLLLCLLSGVRWPRAPDCHEPSHCYCRLCRQSAAGPCQLRAWCLRGAKKVQRLSFRIRPPQYRRSEHLLSLLSTCLECQALPVTVPGHRHSNLQYT